MKNLTMKNNPGRGTPWNFWRGCAAHNSKSRPNFRPKNAIFHTRFQTWPQKSIPVFRPDLENIHPFSDMALESRYIINNSLLHYPSEATTMIVVFVQIGNAFFVD